MSMVVKNNMEAVRTLNILNFNSNNLQNSLAKVSSGMKINSAQDDASGYAISERMRVRIRALDQANQNAQNDSSLMKTAEGAVNNTIDLLRTLKEKAINAANDSNTDEDRATIQKEIDQFIDQVDDNALVQFNGKYLVDGSKNYVAPATVGTKTVFYNQSLADTTTGGTLATALKNRAGSSLGIQKDDIFEVSFVMNGITSSTSGTITNSTNLTHLLSLDNANGILKSVAQGDNNKSSLSTTSFPTKYNSTLSTPNNENAVFIISKNKGVENQISGFTISILDREGNVKKDATAAVNDFRLLQRAENATQGGQKNMLNFQIGSEANQSIKVALEDMRSQALGLKGSAGDKLSVKTKEHANAAINVIENALTMALNQATTIGAIEARLEYTETNLTTSSENVQSAESTIRDADMAKEMTNYTKNNVLLQSAQAMLAQANQNSNAVLSLLQQ